MQQWRSSFKTVDGGGTRALRGLSAQAEAPSTYSPREAFYPLHPVGGTRVVGRWWMRLWRLGLVPSAWHAWQLMGRVAKPSPPTNQPLPHAARRITTRAAGGSARLDGSARVAPRCSFSTCL